MRASCSGPSPASSLPPPPDPLRLRSLAILAAIKEFGDCVEVFDGLSDVFGAASIMSGRGVVLIGSPG